MVILKKFYSKKTNTQMNIRQIMENNLHLYTDIRTLKEKEVELIDNDEDEIFKFNDVKILIDQTSLNFLKGSKLDFVNDLIGSYFKITNPNANSTCGCGTSFSI